MSILPSERSTDSWPYECLETSGVSTFFCGLLTSPCVITSFSANLQIDVHLHNVLLMVSNVFSPQPTGFSVAHLNDFHYATANWTVVPDVTKDADSLR